MAAEQEYKLNELAEALEIQAEDLLYLVRAPYSLETSFKVPISTLAAYLIAGAAGDVFGPAIAVDGTIPLFDGTTGKIIKASIFTPAYLTNRLNHIGVQPWESIDSDTLPTTLLGYGILDGTGPIEILDEGVSKTEKVTSMDFVGDSVIVTNVDGAVTITIDAGGANTMLLDATQTITGAKTFADSTLLVRNAAGTASTTLKSLATAGRVLSIPDITDTLVTLTATQTLTNKTLTAPVVNLGSDASGDTYYRDAGGLLARLPIGSPGQSMIVAGGLPSWISGAPFVVDIVTADLTLGSTHEMVVADSATPFTITLPDATLNEGRRFFLKNKGAGLVVINAATLGNLFTTASFATLTMARGDSYIVASDGLTWEVL